MQPERTVITVENDKKECLAPILTPIYFEQGVYQSFDEVTQQQLFIWAYLNGFILDGTELEIPLAWIDRVSNAH